MRKTKRAQACAIPEIVKIRVYERDDGLCIFCGRPGDPVAHIVPRSHGGLGVERNIITVCTECHQAMDQGRYRECFVRTAQEYIRSKYGEWSREEVTYRRGRDEVQ